MEQTGMMTSQEKAAIRGALMRFVVKACEQPEKLPPEAISVLPAVLETLVEYFGR